MTCSSTIDARARSIEGAKNGNHSTRQAGTPHQTVLHKEGVSERSLRRSRRDLGDWLDHICTQSAIRELIKNKLPIWIADGVITKRQTMAMTEDELKTFYFRQRSIERYEESKV